MRSDTTTTRRRQPAPVNAAAQLSDEQRVALLLGEAEGWRISVEAGDGSRAQLRPGHPARGLVLLLSPERS